MTKENIKIADLESEELLTPLSLANPIEIPKHEPALATKRWFIYFLGTMPTTVVSMNMASTWPYLQKIDPDVSPKFFGWTNFGFSAAAVSSDIISGKWMHCTSSSRGPLVVLYLILLPTILSYIFAQGVGGQAGLYLVLISKTTIGFQRSVLAISRTLISYATDATERSQAMANLGIANTLGFSIGAGIQAAIAQIGKRAYYISAIKLHLNLYTIPPTFMLIAAIVTIILVLRNIKPFPHEQLQVVSKSSTERYQVKEDYYVGLCLILLYFLVSFSMSVSETLMVPFLQHQFSLTKSEAVWYGGLVLTMQSVIALIQQINLKFLLQKFSERLLILIAFTCVCLTFLLYIPMGNFNGDSTASNSTNLADAAKGTNIGCPAKYHWCKTTPSIWVVQFLLGAFLHASGISLCITLSMSLYSKVIPKNNLGQSLSFLSAAGNFGRVVAPLASAESYVEIGPQFTFLWVLLVLCIGLVLYASLYRRIVVIKVEELVDTVKDDSSNDVNATYVTPV